MEYGDEMNAGLGWTSAVFIVSFSRGPLWDGDEEEFERVFLGWAGRSWLGLDRLVDDDGAKLAGECEGSVVPIQLCFPEGDSEVWR